MKRFLAFLLLSLWCAAPLRAETNAVPFQLIDVDANRAAALVKDGKVVVLDVRTPGEFAGGHLAGALNHDVRAKGFAEKMKGLKPAAPLLVHCASGVRSRTAVRVLREIGTAGTVYHLDGGIRAWTAAGHSTVRP